MVIYRPDNTPIWDTGTWITGGPAATSPDMQPGEVLSAGASITSADGRYTLVYQTDGNLVLYGPAGAMWASNTAGKPVGSAVMQGDGNLDRQWYSQCGRCGATHGGPADLGQLGGGGHR